MFSPYTCFEAENIRKAILILIYIVILSAEPGMESAICLPDRCNICRPIVCLDLRCCAATALSHRWGGRGGSRRLKVNSSYTNLRFSLLLKPFLFSAHICKPSKGIKGHFLVFRRLSATSESSEHVPRHSVFSPPRSE